MTHKSEDYKISAVKYYLKNEDNIRKTCKIFNCKKSTLQRWITKPLKYYKKKPKICILQNYKTTSENCVGIVETKRTTYNDYLVDYF